MKSWEMEQPTAGLPKGPGEKQGCFCSLFSIQRLENNLPRIKSLTNIPIKTQMELKVPGIYLAISFSIHKKMKKSIQDCLELPLFST